MMFSFQNLQTKIRTFFIVVLIAVVVSVAGILLLKTLQPTPSTQQPLGDTSDEVDVDKNSSSVRFAGEVLRGQTFEKEIGQKLVFRLIPGSGGVDWTISIGDKTDAKSNFAGVVTPPYRGINHLYISGWHFRNSDNSGPNEIGPKNVNALGEVREFFFVLDSEDYEKAWGALDKMLWSGNWSREEVEEAMDAHTSLRKGIGLLRITDMKLGNLVAGERAWIEKMKFEVELTFSEDSQKIDTSTWQTYRNDEFGFEVKYPKGWGTKMEGPQEDSMMFQIRNETTQSVFAVTEARGEASGKKGISLEDWVEEIVRSVWDPEQVSEVMARYEAIVINGIKAFRFDDSRNESGDGLTYIEVFIANGSAKIFTLILDSESSGDDKILDQILATFRFVEPSAIQWSWNLLGCGGQVPCFYRVSSREWPDSYSCVGKYNPLSSQGEISPTSYTDPRTTADFTCKKE